MQRRSDIGGIADRLLGLCGAAGGSEGKGSERAAWPAGRPLSRLSSFLSSCLSPGSSGSCRS